MTIKEVKMVNYVSCMDPILRSFTINPHLQQHFLTLEIRVPPDDQ
jgi:hypothetical protein